MLLLVHNALNSLAHYYISDWFSVYNPIRPLRSPGANLVTIRSKCAECFSYCGPFLWNTFSADVRSVTTVSSFRKKLSFWESLSVLTGLSYIHAGNHLLIAYCIKADSSLLADIPRSSCLGDHLMYLLPGHVSINSNLYSHWQLLQLPAWKLRKLYLRSDASL